MNDFPIILNCISQILLIFHLCCLPNLHSNPLANYYIHFNTTTGDLKLHLDMNFYLCKK